MNKEQIEGNWEQFKGKLRETWGKLSDDDLALAQGRAEQFFGKVKEKHGIAIEEAERLYNQLAAASNYKQVAKNSNEKNNERAA